MKGRWAPGKEGERLTPRSSSLWECEDKLKPSDFANLYIGYCWWGNVLVGAQWGMGYVIVQATLQG